MGGIVQNNNPDTDAQLGSKRKREVKEEEKVDKKPKIEEISSTTNGDAVADENKPLNGENGEKKKKKKKKVKEEEAAAEPVTPVAEKKKKKKKVKTEPLEA